MQSGRVGARLNSSKLSPEKLVDVQDADKSSELDVTGFHINSQGGKGYDILSSKTSQVCHTSQKSSLGVKLLRVNVEKACSICVQQSRKLCAIVQPALVFDKLNTSKSPL